MGATTQTYTYSGDGLRLRAATGPGAATTTFAWDRAFALPQVALERDGSGTLLRRASYGLDRVALSTPALSSLLHPDPLGSVSDVVAPNGSPLAWSEYAPFGALRYAGAVAGAPSVPYGFTGQYRDAVTGLYHLRARQYDPATSRFLSTDPLTATIGDPYVASYVYGRNNPLRWSDPSGECVPAALPVFAAAGFGAFSLETTAAGILCTALVAGLTAIIIGDGVRNLSAPTAPINVGLMPPQANDARPTAEPIPVPSLPGVDRDLAGHMNRYKSPDLVGNQPPIYCPGAAGKLLCIAVVGVLAAGGAAWITGIGSGMKPSATPVPSSPTGGSGGK